jgi:hypothetical protein
MQSLRTTALAFLFFDETAQELLIKESPGSATIRAAELKNFFDEDQYINDRYTH